MVRTAKRRSGAVTKCLDDCRAAKSDEQPSPSVSGSPQDGQVQQARIISCRHRATSSATSTHRTSSQRQDACSISVPRRLCALGTRYTKVGSRSGRKEFRIWLALECSEDCLAADVVTRELRDITTRRLVACRNTHNVWKYSYLTLSFSNQSSHA